MEHRRNDADAVLRQYAARAREENVSIQLHKVPDGRPVISGMKRGIIWGYSVVAAAVVVLGLFVLVERPQKIYGHMNGVPITDREEAIRHSQQMFEDLAVGMAPAEDVLDNLFSL